MENLDNNEKEKELKGIQEESSVILKEMMDRYDGLYKRCRSLITDEGDQEPKKVLEHLSTALRDIYNLRRENSLL